jgi:hypothetical protein
LRISAVIPSTSLTRCAVRVEAGDGIESEIDRAHTLDGWGLGQRCARDRANGHTGE